MGDEKGAASPLPMTRRDAAARAGQMGNRYIALILTSGPSAPLFTEAGTENCYPSLLIIFC